jgi:hypothetical protein
LSAAAAAAASGVGHNMHIHKAESALRTKSCVLPQENRAQPQMAVQERQQQQQH